MKKYILSSVLSIMGCALLGATLTNEKYVGEKIDESKSEIISEISTDASITNAAAVAAAKAYADTQINLAIDLAKDYIDDEIEPVADQANTNAGNISALSVIVSENKSEADTKFAELNTTVNNNKVAANNALIATNVALVAKINSDVVGAKSEASAALATARTEITAQISTAVDSAKSSAVSEANAYTDGKVAGVYHFKGTCTFDMLPEDGQSVADVWYVSDREESYTWGESGEWLPLGKKFDLSAYKTWSDTETAVDAKVAVVDTKVTELSSVVTTNKGTSDAAVAALDGRVTELEGTVAGIPDNYTAADTALKNELTPLITAAQTKADQGVTDAAAASAKVDTSVAAAKTAIGEVIVATNDLLVAQIGAAKTAAVEEAGTEADAKITAKSGNILGTIKEYVDTTNSQTYEYVDQEVAAVSNNVVQIAATDATSKADTAKEEAVAISAYAWDLTTAPVASKTIGDITYQNVYLLKNMTALTIESDEAVITIQVPLKSGATSIQRASEVYLNYTGTSKPSIAIVGEEGQTILTGESGSKYSDIDTGKWFLYVLEISPNVFWIQTEKFTN